MTGFIVSPQWTRLRIGDLQGSVMVVGASDTGKSTFACYLYQRFSDQGLRAAYLDADVGQSILGLPTTMTVALSAGPGDDRFPPEGAQATYFVGATTPKGNMLPAVIGAHRLQQKALALGAQVIVVDTTGLVDRTQGGKALKQWKIELLAPTMVIGLQRDCELESILWPLRRDDRVQSASLPVSPHVLVRSREARFNRRRQRLACYFEGAESRRVSLRQTAVYDLDRLVKGRLLAFQDAQGFCLGLGVVEEADRQAGTALIRTPLAGREAASLRFGVARWDLANNREF